MTAAASDSLRGCKSGNSGALGLGGPEFRSCFSTDWLGSLVKLLLCPELQAPIIQWQEQRPPRVLAEGGSLSGIQCLVHGHGGTWAVEVILCHV